LSEITPNTGEKKKLFGDSLIRSDSAKIQTKLTGFSSQQKNRLLINLSQESPEVLK
jgi:hypothetical protein